MSPLRSEGKVKHDGKCLGFWVEFWGNAPITMTMSLLTFLPSDCRGRRLWVAFVEVHGNTYTQTGGLPQSTHPSICLSKSNPHAGSSNLFLGEHFWCQFDNHISYYSYHFIVYTSEKNKSVKPAWWALCGFGLPRNTGFLSRNKNNPEGLTAIENICSLYWELKRTF